MKKVVKKLAVHPQGNIRLTRTHAKIKRTEEGKGKEWRGHTRKDGSLGKLRAEGRNAP